jgi:two-component system nitrogen regulation sensor histidine kinase NtrY
VDFSRFKPVHEGRVLLLALAAGLPAVITSMIILWWLGDYSSKVQWTLSVIIIGAWWGFAAAVRERVASPLRTLANLLEAMREGDYSIRARGARGEEALGDVMAQVNEMGATLREQRLGALEATTLLRKVMEEIDVAIFAFDGNRKLKLVNRAGERLVAQPAERIMNADAESLGLAEFLEGAETRNVQQTFPSIRTLGHSSRHVSRRRIAASTTGGHRPDARAA